MCCMSLAFCSSKFDVHPVIVLTVRDSQLNAQPRIAFLQAAVFCKPLNPALAFVIDCCKKLSGL